MKIGTHKFLFRNRNDVASYVRMRMSEKGNELYEAHGYVLTGCNVNMFFNLIEDQKG